MATLRDIRRRITAVKGTSKITQAMKMVSAARLKRSQKAIWSARPYVEKMEYTLSNLMETVGSDYSHSLIEEHKEINNIAIVVISSDRGLCGSFNTNLFRYVREYISNEIRVKFPTANIHLVTVGKKSKSFFRKTQYNILFNLTDIFSRLEFEHSKSIVESVKKSYISKNIDLVLVFYNEFVNIIKQVPTYKYLLPIKPIEKQNSESLKRKFSINYIFEPGKEQILDVLLPKLLDIQIWRALLESSAAEQASRMMAMDNATTNALELIDHLELVFNKARQAMITKEMLEIVSGAEALKQS